MSITVICANCRCRFALGEALFDDWMDARRSLICPRCESYLKYASREVATVRYWRFFCRRLGIALLVALPVTGMARLFSENFLPTLLVLVATAYLVQFFFVSTPILIVTEVIPQEALGRVHQAKTFDHNSGE